MTQKLDRSGRHCQVGTSLSGQDVTVRSICQVRMSGQTLTVRLYMGRLVTQYRKSASARLTMKMVVYLRGVLWNPSILLAWAQGMARRVRRLPAAPTVATRMHLDSSVSNAHAHWDTHNTPARLAKLTLKG